ncbi:hypothetical protein [Paenibacillus spongiae]|uniref:Uncharacterized protein n=1 Tax=Paenibacillus spongiae TaxID=2909671 RepID=A0ABY5S7U9_9BACL|nr:hypothetical protein [Paenibacillus spongiae]UVI29660.1 hypothetical protein L1F29_30325 [Paenibacillus spongiae]
MSACSTFTDAELLAKTGIEGIVSKALVAENAASIIQPGDEIKKEASITIFTDEGRSKSDHYVMECESPSGNLYILCMGVGKGKALMNYDPDEMLSFREECEDNGIGIDPGKPLLAYSYRGIARME